MVLDKSLDGVSGDGTFAPGLAGGPLQTGADGSLRRPWQRLKPAIEILCNNQASYFSSKL